MLAKQISSEKNSAYLCITSRLAQVGLYQLLFKRMNRNTRRLFIIALIIAIVGLLAIYSTSYQEGLLKERNIFFRQLIWVCLGVVIFFVFSNFNYRKFYDLSFIFYSLSIALLVFVLVFGRAKFGAQRWLEFAGFSFQPSELAKFSIILFLSRYFSRKDRFNLQWQARDLKPFRSVIIPAISVTVPTVLILEQPDLGMAMIFVFIFFSLVFVAGVKKRYIWSLAGLGILMFPVFWHLLRGYQRERLLVFLNPDIDPLGAGYTVIQSKIAVGSGRLFGRGWLSGTQNTLNFLPERHTDFIFSCFSESCGFLGAAILIALFYLLSRECIDVIYGTRDPFARLLVTGIIAVISLQVVINISMTIGLSPVVGIPLPLVSYGGTSTLITFMGIGIIANISKERMIF